MKLTRELKSALALGSMCVISYLGCYMARNLLSVVTPDMVENTSFTIESIGTLSTIYMVVYALGQLVNGRIGDMFRAKWLVGAGLALAGVCNFMMPIFDSVLVTSIIYGASGLFQSMIYAPLMRTIAENTLPHHARRCCLGFTVASFLGTPVASLVAMLFNWEIAFYVCGGVLVLLGIACYVSFDIFERCGIISYKKDASGKISTPFSLPVLIKRGIIKFTVVAILTGIIRTSVVFWIPTYLTDYLGYSKDTAALLFSVITIIKTANPYVTILILYERLLHRNINASLLVTFSVSLAAFAIIPIVVSPVVNMILLTVALFFSGCAATLVYSVWCPSLSDTGMVSSATGFVDAASYLGAGVANLLFANAINTIGWTWLIIIWATLMAVGLPTAIPYDKIKLKRG